MDLDAATGTWPSFSMKISMKIFTMTTMKNLLPEQIPEGQFRCLHLSLASNFCTTISCMREICPTLTFIKGHGMSLPWKSTLIVVPCLRKDFKSWTANENVYQISLCFQDYKDRGEHVHDVTLSSPFIHGWLSRSSKLWLSWWSSEPTFCILLNVFIYIQYIIIKFFLNILFSL